MESRHKWGDRRAAAPSSTPWVIGPERWIDGHRFVFVSVGPGGHTVALVQVDEGDPEQQDALGLIAAARDLLAALRQIANISGNLPDDRLTSATGPNDAAARGIKLCAAREIARAAIAAATGGAP